ncbi:hypothetical protein SUGI_0235020 [Cryptomeria japonica]|uniref:F-box/kelch-repeat protein At1g15670-like n=1 Tax=Cryptomeria japonica TaxID=3369 RepID=UPI002408976D|nr:F-box/kelch-repeat protein At1g15670-like [Cryptomeria japonica]GLJ14524.1 hypothetical protein SUGI_0235020 [Cryptomeria japonica]
MDFLQELPEQIFRDILLRVSYESQPKIKELLEPAKEMMESSDFYQDRIKFGVANNYICLLIQYTAYSYMISIYNPVDESFILHTRIPRRFEASNYPRILYAKNKLVLLGLQFDGSYTSTILIYDLLSNTWKQGAQIPIAQRINNFACCVSPEGLIYIAGGYFNYNWVNFRRDFSRKAAVYKVDEDEWELLPDMQHEMTDCGGVFYEGMFYVISRNNRTQRFDPNTRVWTILNLSSPIPQSVHVMFGRLIAVTDSKIEQYDSEGNVWRELEPLPKFLHYVKATVWTDRIFLCGYESSRCRRLKFYMYKVAAERWISFSEPKFSEEVILVTSIFTIEI